MSIYSTKQRTELLLFFQNRPNDIFNATQIFDGLQNSRISLSAVYRNLNLLEKENKIKKVTVEKSREKFYQYIRHESCYEKLHLFCDKCDTIFHMEATLANHIVNDIENNAEFNINKTTTKLYGICKACKVETNV